ncbi:MAG: hypothetical protein C0404_09625 [Verrucomicrobia bacterium]|nr:hypothetical protein [Verrucomicrobiota bacterium]
MGFDSSWRWRKEHGDRYFREFWGKAVQFLGLPHLLGESAQARIFLDRISASVGEKVVITASVRNRDYSPLVAEKVVVTAKQQDQKDRELVLQAVPQRPGVFRATFYPENEGNVSLRLPAEYQSEPIDLTVQKINREFTDSGVKLAYLSDISRKTAGTVFYQAMTAWPTNAPTVEAARDTPRAARESELATLHHEITRSGANQYSNGEYMRKLSRHILATISENRVPVPILIEKDLWDSLGLMLLALLLLCTEYTLRKLWHLD